MEHRFFKWQGAEAADEILAFQSLRQPFHNACKEIAASYGAASIMHKGQFSVGLAFDEDPGELRGMKVFRSVVQQDGKRVERYVAEPNKRFKEGKQLQNQLDYLTRLAMDSKADSFSTWFINRHHLGCDTIGHHQRGMAMYSSVAGCDLKRELIVVKMPNPEGDGSERTLEDAKFPEIPPQFVELKKSEFIALVEEGA